VGDINFQSKCMQEFNRYRNMGKTVIFVTHDIATVQRYCDRAMLLRNGKIEIIGNSEKVCSKYIYQNMSDEEKRLHKEDKRKKIKSVEHEEAKKEKILEDISKWGTKEIVIEKVDFLDNNHNPRKVFETFEDITIRIHFKLLKEVKEAVFGIEIFNLLNQLLFGFNTKMREKAIRLDMGKKYVDFIIRDNPFLKGRYYINLGIADKDCIRQYYYWSRSGEFTIMNGGYEKNYLGDVSINIEIDE
jgi:teichoic acid transport system ATP-binding protein